MAIIMRLVQQYHASKKKELHALEKQFVELEHRGILPTGERLAPISGRELGNPLVWQCRFAFLAAAEKALKQMENSNEHTELANQQHALFQQSWGEFYEVLEY